MLDRAFHVESIEALRSIVTVCVECIFKVTALVWSVLFVTFSTDTWVFTSEYIHETKFVINIFMDLYIKQLEVV